jgi:hypothetical protein
MSPTFLSLASLLSFVALANADFPALYNSDPGDAQPPTPQESLKMLKLPPGFKATLFAAEPDVQNPIAMAWDAKGRMWVAENYTYAERQKRFDLGLEDRVIILEDKDWDGVAETRKVFTEDVQMLTSVEVGRGGVWLMCPPQVLFIPDRNGDDIPDGEPEVVLDGFTVAKDNYHNFANGLRCICAFGGQSFRVHLGVSPFGLMFWSRRMSALEAGNSASIILKHYRELSTPEVAEKWFSIQPKEGQWENTLRYDRKKRRVILNGVECQ